MMALIEEHVDTPALDDSRSDGELVAAVNRGDALAFEVLYRRYQQWVVNLAYRFTADRELSLDVMQETFLYFLKKFPGFQLRAQLKTFFYPVVRHLAIAARRKAQRCQPADQESFDIESLPASEESPMTLDSVAPVLAALSPKHREVLLMRFIDGFSLAEIAQALRIPVGTVKSRLHDALQTLRENPDTKKFFEH